MDSQPITFEPTAIGIVKSKNSKIGNVSATYASQRSCPKTCPFLNKGCYAEGGMTGFTTRRLNKSNPKATPEMVARDEAKAIDNMPANRDLRLHVVGDSRTNRSARIVSGAVVRYMLRGGKKAWTYTHAWRKVKRANWRTVSVLASCENTKDITEAKALGYATAIVVDTFPTDENGNFIPKAYELDGHKILPCPEQTKGITCDNCRQCWNDESLKKRGVTIAFSAHGPRTNKVIEQLHLSDGPKCPSEE